MFDQANSFYICAELCEKELEKHPGRHDLYSTPQIVNLAFACEVYFKTLLDFHKIAFKKKHKLSDLFDLLPSSDKEYIDRELSVKYPFNNPFGRRKIDVEADAFVEWRYSYEKHTLSCDIGYLKALAKVLQELCSKELYDCSWEQYCYIVKINSDL